MKAMLTIALDIWIAEMSVSAIVTSPAAKALHALTLTVELKKTKCMLQSGRLGPRLR